MTLSAACGECRNSLPGLHSQCMLACRAEYQGTGHHAHRRDWVQVGLAQAVTAAPAQPGVVLATWHVLLPSCTWRTHGGFPACKRNMTSLRSHIILATNSLLIKRTAANRILRRRSGRLLGTPRSIAGLHRVGMPHRTPHCHRLQSSRHCSRAERRCLGILWVLTVRIYVSGTGLMTDVMLATINDHVRMYILPGAAAHTLVAQQERGDLACAPGIL